MSFKDLFIEPEKEYKERKARERREKEHIQNLKQTNPKDLNDYEQSEIRGYEFRQRRPKTLGGYLAKWSGEDIRHRKRKKEIHTKMKRPKKKRRAVDRLTGGLTDLTRTFRQASRGHIWMR